MSHTIQISKSLYKELLFQGNEMKKIDLKYNVECLAADILNSVLCTLNFPHPLSTRFISLVDQTENRLNRQLDIHDRSKTVKISNRTYKTLNRIKGDYTVSNMACIVLSKGLVIMYMDLTELTKLKCIYTEACS